LEELILIEPQNSNVFSKLAEIFYTLGIFDLIIFFVTKTIFPFYFKLENYKLARKYFAASIAASRGITNLRGLYGLYLVFISVNFLSFFFFHDFFFFFLLNFC
jgi:hypothetical protein